MKKDIIEKQSVSGFAKFLQKIEYIGNKLPDLTILFIIMTFIVLIVSYLLSFVNFNYIHPGTKEKIAIINMLEINQLITLLTKMENNFVNFPPLGIVIVSVLGIGIAEGSGFIKTMLIKLLVIINKRNVVPVVIIVAICCHIASDAVYVVLMPISALIFYTLGRHPIAGISTAFAGLSGGFAASYTPSIVDPIMQKFTQDAARLIEPSYDVNVLCNYFLFLGATFSVIIGCWFVTNKIIEPFLWKNCPIDTSNIKDIKFETISKKENRAFKIAFFIFILLCILLAIALYPQNSLFRSTTSGSLTSRDAPIMQMIVPLLFLFLAIPGYIYGTLSGNFKTSKDIVVSMCKHVESLITFIVFSFFCAQFLYIFNNSNIGILAALSGAEFIKSLNTPPQITILGIIILTAILNLFITSATSKWAILASIFVPMLMLVGISPELTQAAFRISDSAMNVATPMFAFYPLIISYCQVYYKKTGTGTLLSIMIPYSIALLIILTITLYLYWWFNIPLGFDSGYIYNQVS